MKMEDLPAGPSEVSSVFNLDEKKKYTRESGKLTFGKRLFSLFRMLWIVRMVKMVAFISRGALGSMWRWRRARLWSR